MEFRVGPERPGPTSVEISADGEHWGLLAMAVTPRAAQVIVNAFNIVMEAHADDALEEIIQTLED